MKARIAKTSLTLTKEEFKFLQDFEEFLRDYTFSVDGDDTDVDETYMYALDGFRYADDAEDINKRFKESGLQIEVAIEG